jgi:MFS family permease
MLKIFPFNQKQTHLIFLSGLGGLLEFYDFIIYALLASYIAHNFFPTGNYVTSLLATFATFSVGYLARPIGGFVFGHYGDKIGRKTSFTLTIFLMALSTFAIGLVPNYQSIGMTAPIILLILRLLQGFSIGGEIPGAITYISESVPERHGLGCGLIFFSLVNGIVLGSIIHVILNIIFTQAQITAWAWRLPFFLGGILGGISYILRRQFYESPLFVAIEKQTIKFPLLAVLKTNFRSFICGMFLVALGASMITLLFLFTPAYLTKLLAYSPKTFAWINTISLFISTILIVAVGFASDFINKKIWLLTIAIASLMLAYPIFSIFVQQKYSLWIPMLLSVLIFGSIWGLIPPTLAEIFPTNMRYSGVAFAYNLGFAIFGGLTPLIAMTLIHYTKVLQSPSYYLIATSIIGIICILILPKRKLL